MKSKVCVICGTEWMPVLNVCTKCGALCAWGDHIGADPDSWIVNEDGSWTPKQPPPTDPEAA